MFSIKKFSETKKIFQELTRIDNLVYHDHIADPNYDYRQWKIRDKNLVKDRLLLFNEKVLIGVLYYSQGRNENNKTTFFTLHIDPKYNSLQTKELLYERMLKEIKCYNSNKIITSIYEHSNYDLVKNFLIKKKFKLVQTNREYSCNITKINFEKYKPLIKKLKSSGIEFFDSKNEMSDWPNHYKKLEELEWNYSQDYPIPEGIYNTRAPFEHWYRLCQDFYSNNYGIQIVAVKNNQYIGSTDIEINPKTEPKKAWTGGLGVIKKFRRRGVATALKIKAFENLINKKIIEVRTDNEENNPMYKINVKLGFKPVPFSLEYMKEI